MLPTSVKVIEAWKREGGRQQPRQRLESSLESSWITVFPKRKRLALHISRKYHFDKKKCGFESFLNTFADKQISSHIFVVKGFCVLPILLPASGEKLWVGNSGYSPGNRGALESGWPWVFHR